MPVDLLDLRDRIRKLSPSQRLIVAATMIEQRRFDLAEAIAQSVIDELKLVRLLGGK